MNESSPSSPSEEELRAKFRGALIGAAVGDALGAPFESSPRTSVADVSSGDPAHGLLEIVLAREEH